MAQHALIHRYENVAEDAQIFGEVVDTIPSTEATFETSPESFWIENVSDDVEGLWLWRGPDFEDGETLVPLDWNLTDEQKLEQKRQIIRDYRDYLLGDHDWLVTKYAEKGWTLPTEWLEYRQTLRDAPSTVTLETEVNVETFFPAVPAIPVDPE